MKKLIILLLITGLTGILVLAYFQPLSSYQEAKTAFIVKETAQSSSFVPTYNGKPYFTAPPLYTWISIPFYKILSNLPGGDTFALRLVSILSYIFLLLCLSFLYEENFSSYLLGILVLLSSYRFLAFITQIDFEPLFVFLTFLMFLNSYFYLKTAKKIYKLGFYLFLALSFLVKGPLHFFLLPALLLYGIILREKRAFSLLFYPPGWIITFVLIIPWYLYGYANFGKEAFQQFLFMNLKLRLTEHKAPVYYYFKALILNFIPYFLLTFFAILRFKKKEYEIKKESFLAFIFFSAFIPVLLLSFTGEKFDKYLLYLYPLWAIFFSLWLSKFYSINFLQKVATLCFLINLATYFVIHIYKLEKISYKVQVIRATMRSYQTKKLAFWQNQHPLMIYYYNKPIEVLKSYQEVKKYLKKGYHIISLEPILNLTPEKVILDPYKDKIWYILKKP